MAAVIKVENLYKQYRLGEVGTGSMKDDIKRWSYRMMGKEDPYLNIGEENDRTKKANNKYVWALKDINFEVQQGEILGIIGKNGAGKSTLLKILSRTTGPTKGTLKMKGRVASLLEVGTGFHGELSGRENIYLNGAIMGMRREEITRKFDEIVDFAGVERYIDTPVKRYSSGMYVRLAFGVAAHLEPDIMIVDEVLAVGDSEFQKKALSKMKDVSRNNGRTVLFVSHNLASVRKLCKTGMVLKNGRVEFVGSIADSVYNYLKYENDTEERLMLNAYRSYEVTESPVIIDNICLAGYENEVPTLKMDEYPEIIIRVKAKEKIENANITISFYNSKEVNLGIAFSWDDNFSLNLKEPGLYEIHFHLKDHQFVPNRYSISVGLNQSDKTQAWDIISFYPLFNVKDFDNVDTFKHRNWGINHFVQNQWRIKHLC